MPGPPRCRPAPCLRGQPCSAHRCGARPSSARSRGGVPARKRVCAGGEASRAAGALYGMRAEGPSERVGSAWFLCPQFSASLSAPRRLVGSREEPCSFLRGISRTGGSRGPEALHGDRPPRGCPSHSKGGRRWATRPSTSTVGRRTTSRSSLAPYAATWWTHHCSPPATTSSALRACKTGWTACRNAQRAPPSSTRGMVLVRCSRGRRSPGELPLHTSH